MEMATTAKVAWPHFVPRLELDVEITALNTRLDEICDRISQVEAHGTNQLTRFEELLSRCGGEGALGSLANRSELAALELRLGQKLSSEATELTVELEELRRTTVESTELSILRTEHTDCLESLAKGIAHLQEDLQKLELEHQAVSDHGKATYATQVDVQEAINRLQTSSSEISANLQQAYGSIEALQASSVDLAGKHDLTKSIVEQLQLASDTASTSIDALRQDMSRVQQLYSVVPTQKYVDEVSNSVADAHAKLDYAMMDRATLRRQFESQNDVTSKHISRHQETFQNLDDVVSKLEACYSSVQTIERNREKHEQRIEQVVSQQNELRQVLQSANDAQKADIAHLEGMCNALRQDFHVQAEKVQQTADSLGLSSTRISLEQMEQALHLRKSLDELSQGHAELKSTVHSSAELKPVRGSEGWEVARTPQ
eukprot:TRINITY_DN3529_c1_g1_i1.p1 TRINITY_DN3529_c1_g1~~TRINITY_DN3529_c1_g1_i1.p1  ORF type:complete len:449 (+),score=76.94 TRINITY_DN3529_c1_g1_i1:60-1349(+)